MQLRITYAHLKCKDYHGQFGWPTVCVPRDTVVMIAVDSQMTVHQNKGYSLALEIRAQESKGTRRDASRQASLLVKMGR